MPKTAGEFINDLAQKAGIAADDAALKTFLAFPELANIQVPDTIVTAVDGGLLSLEAAKNNHPEIMKVYTSQVYDGMDKNLWKIIEEGDFSDEDKAKIKAEPKTRERYALAISILKAQKASAKGPDKDEINRRIAEANEAARLAKEALAAKDKEWEGKLNEIQMDAAMKAVFGEYKTVYDEMPAVAKTAAMKALVTTTLNEKKAILKTDEHGSLVLVGQDGTNIFGENNVQMTPKSLFDKTFAPILKNSGPPKPIQPIKPGTPIPKTVTVDDKVEATVEGIKSHNQQVIADMQQKTSLV